MAMEQNNLAAQVLIVEDEPDHADVMAEALKRFGHVCTIVGDVERAVDELRHGSFDVIITDLRMPGSAGVKVGDLQVGEGGADAGLRVLEAARRMQPEAETIMVTAHGDVGTARAAFKHGAYDFIEKPLDLDVFRNLVNRAAETVLLRHQYGGVRGGARVTGGGGEAGLGELVQHDGFEGIIAGSEPMRKILQTVKTVAASSLPVLITGESGTGKELIAQAVHRNSNRAKGRYVAFNCAGQSETLIEDALFGHVRGAFTGAEKDREGVFEYASGGAGGGGAGGGGAGGGGAGGGGAGGGGGTLFLDEIGDMPASMQAKLLRVLESGEVVRIGSNEPRKVNVRFVSATNRDLQRAIAEGGEGGFRQDLFFRIKGAHVHLPPLRDRREDIPRITRHAIARFAEEMRGKGVVVPDITDAAMMRLTAYSWPGNVRQLLNVVQNMVVMALGETDGADGGPVRIDVRHIPDEITTADEADGAEALDGAAAAGVGAGGGSLAGTSLEQIEKRAIRETLRLTGGNRERAAKLLGIGERTLYRKLREYGLR